MSRRTHGAERRVGVAVAKRLDRDESGARRKARHGNGIGAHCGVGIELAPRAFHLGQSVQHALSVHRQQLRVARRSRREFDDRIAHRRVSCRPKHRSRASGQFHVRLAGMVILEARVGDQGQHRRPAYD